MLGDRHKAKHAPILALALLLATTIVACRPTVVREPVIVTPPPCRERDAPLKPPEGAVYGDATWARWFATELVPWIAEVETACPKREHPPGETTAGIYGEAVR